MNGFVVIIPNSRKKIATKIKWKTPFSFQDKHVLRKVEKEVFIAEQFTSEKFINEKLFIDTDDFFCITDGLIINKDELKKRNKVENNIELIDKIAQKKKTFFEDFEGNFVGVFYDKINNKWLAFNNQVGAKKLFYYSNNDFTIFATDLAILSQILKSNNISINLDITASYLMLDLGYMINDKTLIKEVKQITAGNYVELFQNKTEQYSYFNLKDIEENKDDKSTIIEKLDKKFCKAIETEFYLDKKHKYSNLGTISGGLDSRMTSLIAYKLGYKDQLLINFSEKGYADEVIAKQIVKTYNIDTQHISISPTCLTNIDDVIKVNDGLTIYTGAGHMFSILNEIPKKDIGCFHTGMIGDGVLGSFLSKPYHLNLDEYGKKILSELNFAKSKEYVRKSIKKYPTEELYKYYTRGFLGANNGFLFYDLIGEGLSPFLHTDFLSYAYSIPAKLKYKERIYIDWINEKHPDIANFVWETIGGKPTNSKVLRFYYRWKRAVIKRLPIKTMWKNNMNPEQLWYDNNPKIKEYLDNYFSEYLDLVEAKELKKAIVFQYENGDIEQKAKCLTLLGAIKLLF